MVKNSQKKGSLPKGGEPNGGVKKVRNLFGPIKCNVVVLDYEKLFFMETGLCPYRSKNKKAYKAWLNEMHCS